MIRKFFLAKGMFLTKLSLAKGIRSETGTAQPPLIFFGVPPGVIRASPAKFTIMIASKVAILVAYGHTILGLINSIASHG